MAKKPAVAPVAPVAPVTPAAPPDAVSAETAETSGKPRVMQLQRNVGRHLAGETFTEAGAAEAGIKAEDLKAIS